MKKFIYMCLITVPCLALFACAGNSAGSATPTEEPAKAPENVSIERSITQGDLVFTATEIIVNNDAKLVEDADVAKVVAVKFTVENTSSEEQAIAGLMLFDSYADDTKCLMSLAGAVVYAPMLNGNLAENKKMVGYHVVEVPKDAKTLMLRFNELLYGDVGDDFLFDIPQ